MESRCGSFSLHVDTMPKTGILRDHDKDAHRCTQEDASSPSLGPGRRIQRRVHFERLGQSGVDRWTMIEHRKDRILTPYQPYQAEGLWNHCAVSIFRVLPVKTWNDPN
jgi:hypothetical protein